jgi:hypothetical protein
MRLKPKDFIESSTLGAIMNGRRYGWIGGRKDGWIYGGCICLALL